MRVIAPVVFVLLLLVVAFAVIWFAAAPAHAEPVYNATDVRLAIAEAAATYGLSESRLVRVATCESSLDPYAVGDGGHSFGLAQLNDRRTGLLAHFHSLGYASAFNPYAAMDYLGRAFSGEFRREGIGAWRWSCQ